MEFLLILAIAFVIALVVRKLIGKDSDSIRRSNEVGESLQNMFLRSGVGDAAIKGKDEKKEEGTDKKA